MSVMSRHCGKTALTNQVCPLHPFGKIRDAAHPLSGGFFSNQVSRSAAIAYDLCKRSSKAYCVGLCVIARQNCGTT
jgi:hypothetical protein